MTQDQIKCMLVQVIKKVTQIEVTEFDANLFGDLYQLDPVDMVYVLDYMEKELQQSFGRIFQTENYDIMTVNHISKEIFTLTQDKVV